MKRQAVLEPVLHPVLTQVSRNATLLVGTVEIPVKTDQRQIVLFRNTILIRVVKIQLERFSSLCYARQVIPLNGEDRETAG